MLCFHDEERLLSQKRLLRNMTIIDKYLYTYECFRLQRHHHWLFLLLYRALRAFAVTLGNCYVW